MSDLTKDVPKGTLTKEETIVYLIEVDNRFLIEPSVMRNAIYSACHYLDEESAKEPQEEPNIPLECVDGSCPIALSEEYEERGMDVIHSCAECPYQPPVQPIVRSIDEISDAANMSCPPRYCEHDCGSPEYECKQCWIEWLTKKEV